MCIFKILLHLFCVCVHRHTHVHAITHVWQPRTTFRSHLSPITWVMGRKLRLSGLASSAELVDQLLCIFMNQNLGATGLRLYVRLERGHSAQGHTLLLPRFPAPTLNLAQINLCLQLKESNAIFWTLGHPTQVVDAQTYRHLNINLQMSYERNQGNCKYRLQGGSWLEAERGSEMDPWRWLNSPS